MVIVARELYNVTCNSTKNTGTHGCFPRHGPPSYFASWILLNYHCVLLSQFSFSSIPLSKILLISSDIIHPIINHEVHHCLFSPYRSYRLLSVAGASGRLLQGMDAEHAVLRELDRDAAHFHDKHHVTRSGASWGGPAVGGGSLAELRRSGSV